MKFLILYDREDYNIVSKRSHLQSWQFQNKEVNFVHLNPEYLNLPVKLGHLIIFLS